MVLHDVRMWRLGTWRWCRHQCCGRTRATISKLNYWCLCTSFMTATEHNKWWPIYVHHMFEWGRVKWRSTVFEWGRVKWQSTVFPKCTDWQTNAHDSRSIRLRHCAQSSKCSSCRTDTHHSSTHEELQPKCPGNEQEEPLLSALAYVRSNREE
jgi:hypothetical protein